MKTHVQPARTKNHTRYWLARTYSQVSPAQEAHDDRNPPTLVLKRNEVPDRAEATVQPPPPPFRARYSRRRLLFQHLQRLCRYDTPFSISKPKKSSTTIPTPACPSPDHSTQHCCSVLPAFLHRCPFRPRSWRRGSARSWRRGDSATSRERPTSASSFSACKILMMWSHLRALWTALFDRSAYNLVLLSTHRST